MKALLITAFQADNPINAIDPDRNNDGHLQEFQMRHKEADSYFADPELKNASGITTGETGKLGVTLLSGINSVSKKNVIDIYINAKLFTIKRAETFSYEEYDHTVMFLNTLDRAKPRHTIKGNIDMNSELLNRIIKSRKETIKNIK